MDTKFYAINEIRTCLQLKLIRQKFITTNTDNCRRRSAHNNWLLPQWNKYHMPNLPIVSYIEFLNTMFTIARFIFRIQWISMYRWIIKVKLDSSTFRSSRNIYIYSTELRHWNLIEKYWFRWNIQPAYTRTPTWTHLTHRCECTKNYNQNRRKHEIHFHMYPIYNFSKSKLFNFTLNRIVFIGIRFHWW